MNLEDFKKLEIKLGHPPTSKDVREAKAKKSMFKTANIWFTDSKYNYKTRVNSTLSDEEIIKYFKGKIFNLGQGDKDDLQKCIECTIEASNF